MKGSQYAILKLVESDSFLDSMNRLIKSTDAEIKVYDNWMPKSLQLDREAELKDFLKFNFDPKLGSDIFNWWLQYNGTTPKWDMISTCTISGKRGLLLIEAKAHRSELEDAKLGNSSGTSENSKMNHDRIDKAIKQANSAINEQVEGVAISRDKYYQLSNRVAHAWWLADKGIPVVLLYLGFLNCKDMDNCKNKLFKTDQDWQTSFIEHAKQVGVDKLLGKKVDCGEAEFQMISKSI